MVNLTQNFSSKQLGGTARIASYGITRIWWIDWFTNAQQQSILTRQSESLLEINQSVQTQMEASQILQKRRQGYVSHLARNFGRSEQSTLSEFFPFTRCHTTHV